MWTLSPLWAVTSQTRTNANSRAPSLCLLAQQYKQDRWKRWRPDDPKHNSNQSGHMLGSAQVEPQLDKLSKSWKSQCDEIKCPFFFTRNYIFIFKREAVGKSYLKRGLIVHIFQPHDVVIPSSHIVWYLLFCWGWNNKVDGYFSLFICHAQL